MKIQKRMLRWFGNFEHMDTERMTKSKYIYERSKREKKAWKTKEELVGSDWGNFEIRRCQKNNKSMNEVK